MKKLKILEVTDAFYPVIDGVVKVVDNYAEQLNIIADCTVTAPAPSKKCKYVEGDKYNVVRCESIPSFEGYRFAFPFFINKYKKKIKQANYDIIHLHSPFSMGKIVMSVAKKQGIPVVITLHTKYKQDFERTLGKKSPLVKFMMRFIMRTFNKADCVWTVSYEAEKVLRDYGYKGKIDVVKNGTDFVYPDNPNEYIDRVDELHNLKGQQNVFLFVGRMAMYKGLKLLCDSLTVLNEKGKDFHMIFVGSGFDFDEVKKYVKNLGIEDKCTFTGFISEKKLLQAYYLRSDALIFPSMFDTSGMVKVEAAVNKKCSVLIENSCSAEDVIDGENGFLCQENVESLSNKLLEICDQKELLKKVGERAHDTLCYSWEAVAKEVLHKYEKIIDDYKQAHKPKS